MGIFTYDLLARAASLSFRSGKYTYELIDPLVGKSQIVVSRTNHASLSTLTCDRSTQTLTDTETINLFKTIGLYK